MRCLLQIVSIMILLSSPSPLKSEEVVCSALAQTLPTRAESRLRGLDFPAYDECQNHAVKSPSPYPSPPVDHRSSWLAVRGGEGTIAGTNNSNDVRWHYTMPMAVLRQTQLFARPVAMAVSDDGDEYSLRTRSCQPSQLSIAGQCRSGRLKVARRG